MIEYIQLILTILFCLVGAYTDYKKGYIYDWITLPLIALGLIFAILNKTLIESMITGLLVFGLGYIVYRSGRLGGGDIKLLTGLGIMYPQIYFGLPFVLYVLFLASLYATLWYGTINIYKLYLTKPRYFNIVIIVGCILSLTSIIIFSRFWWLSIILAYVLFIATINIFYNKHIKEMLKTKTKLCDVLDDDLIDLSFIGENEMYPLDKKKLDDLKKTLGANRVVYVYRIMPIFGPAILVGFITLQIILVYWFDLIIYLF